MDYWKGMWWSLLAFLVIPIYYTFSTAESSVYGLSWFGFWIARIEPNSLTSVGMAFDYAFENFSEFLVNGAPTILVLFLATLVWLGYGLRSSKYVKMAFGLSVVLFINVIYVHIYILQQWWNRPDSSYFVLPLDAVLLVPVLAFTFLAQRTTGAIRTETASERPGTGVALILVGAIALMLGSLLMGISEAIRFSELLSALRVYWLTLSVAMVYAAIRVYTAPSSARRWGIFTIVVSLIAGLNLFALIGGVLAMRWKPAAARLGTPSAVSAPVSTSAQTEFKYCQKCGTQIPLAADFCPRCGGRQ